MGAAVVEKPRADVRYRVTSPLAIIPDETAGQLYVQRGQLLPTNCPERIVKHLLASHIVAAVEV